MPNANAQAPQDVANMANAAPAAAPTIVNPIDSFFDDYQVAVEADKARRPKPRPRVVQPQPPAQPASTGGEAGPTGAAKRALTADNADEGAYVALGQKQHDETMADQRIPRSARLSEMMRHETDRQALLNDATDAVNGAEPPRSKESGVAYSPSPGEGGWASRLSGEYKKAQQPTASAAAPHVEAFGKSVAPVKLPSFVKAEKKPMNPKLDSVLAGMPGDRLETMGQEFASTYFKDSGASGYKDDELQQVYLGVQEHLRDRVKKGYKLKTMDEARLFEED